jgi:hypothetical protein
MFRAIALTLRRLRFASVPHKQTARSGVTPKRAEVFLPEDAKRDSAQPQEG